MPCTYDPGPEDYLRSERQRNEKMQRDLDELTVENDRLREALLTLISDREAALHPDVVKIVREEQVEHRKEDLRRLKEHFTETGDALKLGKVMLADPSKSLEPQLGFDPDDF